jgi:chlorite dismutase
MAEQAPFTLEGWYALHQTFAVDWTMLRMMKDERVSLASDAARVLKELADPPNGGWTAAFRLVGGGADLMIVHFRESLEELAQAELRLRQSSAGPVLRLEYEYLSVTEAGLYQATVDAAEQAKPGSKEYQALLDEVAAAERGSAHVRSRLYPKIPEGMRFISFYPMSKRRGLDENWYLLPIGERSRLMRDHGLTGRRFAGKVFQIITGSVGFEDWEWGVTLFAREPLQFKKLVTDMRFDEVSARFGEFGRFFTGIRMDPSEWPSLLTAG